MSSKLFGALVAGAFAASLSTAAMADNHGKGKKKDDKKGAKGETAGWCSHSCKGKATCAGHGSECAGQNACAGKGLPSADCADKAKADCGSPCKWVAGKK